MNSYDILKKKLDELRDPSYDHNLHDLIYAYNELMLGGDNTLTLDIVLDAYKLILIAQDISDEELSKILP